jgi:hypothetical protein
MPKLSSLDEIAADDVPDGVFYAIVDGKSYRVEAADLPGGSGGAGFLANVSEDPSPTLGGNLDPATFTVGAATAADLTKLHATAATAVELSYSAGVTSAIQTQMNAKAAISGQVFTGQIAFSGTDHLGIRHINLSTAQRDLLSPSNGDEIFNNTVNELQVYVSGTGWVALPGSGGGGGGSLDNLVEDTTPQLGGNLDLNSFTVGAATAADLVKVNALTATAIELNYVDGVTSAIQTQLNAGTAFTTSSIAALPGPIEYSIEAGSMIPRITSGPETVTLETTTNNVMSYVLAFDPTADEFAQFSLYLPKGFNGGTVTARFKWSHSDTTTNFDVTWAIQARAFTNDDALDQAFGTAVVVSDAGGTTGDIYTSAETAAITIAGTPTGQKTARFQVYRDVDGNGTAGNDDLAVDAYLHEVILTLTMSALSDA